MDNFLISAIGIVLLVLSIILHIVRTKNYKVLIQFWASTAVLSKTELIINRLGLALVIVGFLYNLYASGII